MLYFDLDPFIAHLLNGTIAMVLPIALSVLIFPSQIMGTIKKTILLGLLLLPTSVFSYLNVMVYGVGKILIVYVYCMVVILIFRRINRNKAPEEPATE